MWPGSSGASNPTGVREIRIRQVSGAFRVIFVARFADAVYVLHCFQKKTPLTYWGGCYARRHQHDGIFRAQCSRVA
jgi:phage-related protein